MTDPAPESDRLDYVRQLVATRCPELAPADLALIAPPSPDDAGIPPSVAAKIMDVLLAFEDWLDRIERAIRAGA